MRRESIVSTLLLLFCVLRNAHAQNALPLDLVADVALPGSASRFDYQSLDGESGRLYIAHLGADRLVIFDTRTRRVLAEVADLKSVHGVIAVPELHRVFATATGTNELAVIDEETFRVLARVPAGDYPNGLAYDPKNSKIYISNNRGGKESVVDARTNKALRPIEIGGGGGNTYYDSTSGHVFVVVHGVNDLVEIDPAVDRVIARYHLTQVDNCHSLIIDSRRQLAFVTCGGTNPRLALFNLRDKRQVALYSIGARPDVLAFDAAMQRLYVSSESGVVSIFDEQDGGLLKIGEGYLASDAHSVAADSTSHFVYFPIENVNGRPVLKIMRPLDRR